MQPITERDWRIIRGVLRDGFATSMHFAVATLGEDGAPNLTPIGSLCLGAPGHGFYLEEYATGLARRLDRDPRLCVMAVNTSRLSFLKALWRGEVREPFAVRLHGTAGARRDATEGELALFRRRVRSLRFLRGHDLLWGKRLRTVREVTFHGFEPVRVGPLGDPWPAPAPPA